MQIGGVVPERGNEPPRVPIYENDDAGTGGLRWRRVCTAHPHEGDRDDPVPPNPGSPRFLRLCRCGPEARRDADSGRRRTARLARHRPVRPGHGPSRRRRRLHCAEGVAAGAKRQLDRTVANTVRGQRANRIETKVVVGDPYQRIVAAARGMDAIVMSTAGRTGLSHLLIGSVAEKLVRHSPIPVLTVRGQTTRRRAQAPARPIRSGVAASAGLR